MTWLLLCKWNGISICLEWEGEKYLGTVVRGRSLKLQLDNKLFSFLYSASISWIIFIHMDIHIHSLKGTEISSSALCNTANSRNIIQFKARKYASAPQNDRIIQAGKDLRRSSNPTCSKQGWCSTQISLLRNLSHRILKTSKDGDYKTSEKPAPMLSYPYNDFLFVCFIESELPLFQFVTVVSCSPTMHLSKELVSTSLRASS